MPVKYEDQCPVVMKKLSEVASISSMSCFTQTYWASFAFLVVSSLSQTFLSASSFNTLESQWKIEFRMFFNYDRYKKYLCSLFLQLFQYILFLGGLGEGTFLGDCSSLNLFLQLPDLLLAFPLLFLLLLVAIGTHSEKGLDILCSLSLLQVHKPIFCEPLHEDLCCIDLLLQVQSMLFFLLDLELQVFHPQIVAFLLMLQLGDLLQLFLDALPQFFILLADRFQVLRHFSRFNLEFGFRCFQLFAYIFLSFYLLLSKSCLLLQFRYLDIFLFLPVQQLAFDRQDLLMKLFSFLLFACQLALEFSHLMVLFLVPLELRKQTIFPLNQVTDCLLACLHNFLEFQMVLSLELKLRCSQAVQPSLGVLHLFVCDLGAKYFLLQGLDFLVLGLDEGFDVLLWRVKHSSIIIIQLILQIFTLTKYYSFAVPEGSAYYRIADQIDNRFKMQNYRQPWHPKQSMPKQISILLIILLLFSTSSASEISPSSSKTLAINASKVLSVLQPTIINLESNYTGRAHKIAASPAGSIEVIEEGSHGGVVMIEMQLIEGDASVYIVVGSETASMFLPQNPGLRKQLQPDDEKQNKLKALVSLSQGINAVNIKNVRLICKEVAPQSEWKDMQNLYLIVVPKEQAKIYLRASNSPPAISAIQTGSTIIIGREQDQLERKIFALHTDQGFAIKFNRLKGFPIVKLYQCPETYPSCHTEYIPVPDKRHEKAAPSAQDFTKFRIESMLTRQQEYMGRKCRKCKLYLVIEAKNQNQLELEVNLQPADYVTALNENQIIKEDLAIGLTKKYSIKLYKPEDVRITIQVYEGEIHALLTQVDNSWHTRSQETIGVITLDIPKQIIEQQSLKSRHFVLQIETTNKDATYSIVYSSGSYEIYIKDGYPTTHIVKPKEQTTFFYRNEQVRQSPIYFTLNINDTMALPKLNMKIYEHQLNSRSRKQFMPLVKADNFTRQTKSIVLQIPGNIAQLEFSFSSTHADPVQLSMTINDEEIIFLPLGHSLSLQVDKQSWVNLLVDNNQEGYIELTIKRCDESSPSVAYSLSPQNFMTGVYDYESMGESERVTRSTIKVKKGGGLYIHIASDESSSSFLQISASYTKIEGRRVSQALASKKGNHGDMHYQLITNSKAEIWFTEVDCSVQCRKATQYICYASNSKSDLYRQMICPGIFMFKSAPGSALRTQSYSLATKPGRDGILAFKQVLAHPIVYLNIKATNPESQTELFYKQLEIVTLSGQLGRVSRQFLFICLGVAVAAVVILMAVVRRQARLGYAAVRSSDRSVKKVQRMKSQETLN